MKREDHPESEEPPAQRNLERVLLPHLDAACNLARWLLRNEDDAQDAVQEAYLRACKAFHRFRGGDGKAWLMTIVRNVCYTTLGKRRAHDTMEPFDETIHASAVEQTSSQSLHAEIDEDLLQLAMEKLPPEFREAIVLHDLEELSYKEIAAIAGIPIGTVMSRLARARQKLRSEILSLQKGGAL